MTDMQYIAHLKFSETCIKCQSQIKQGEPCYWDKDNQADNYHIGCWKGPVTMPFKTEPEKPETTPQPVQVAVEAAASPGTEPPRNMFARISKLINDRRKNQKEEVLMLGNERFPSKYLTMVNGKVCIRGTNIRVLDIAQALNNGMPMAMIAMRDKLPIEAVVEAIDYYKMADRIIRAAGQETPIKEIKGNTMPKQPTEEPINIVDAPAQEQPAAAPAKKGRGRPPKSAKTEIPMEAQASSQEEAQVATPAPKAERKAAPASAKNSEEAELLKIREINLATAKTTTILPVNSFANTPLEDGCLMTPFDVTGKPMGISLKLSPSAIRQAKTIFQSGEEKA